MGNTMEANAGQCKNDLSGYIAALPINLGGTEEANCGLGYSLRKDLLARRSDSIVAGKSKLQEL